MITSYCCRLCFNTTRKESDGNELPSPFLLLHLHRRIRWHITIVFFFSNTKKTKHKKKTNKKNQQKGGSLPSSSRFALSLLAPAFALSLLHFHFKCSLGIFFFSNKRKKNTHIEKKNIKKKKMHRREGVYLQAPALPFHF